MTASAKAFPIKALRDAFGSNLQENVMLANYTTARVGWCGGSHAHHSFCQRNG